jgi:hypothetical protein
MLSIKSYKKMQKESTPIFGTGDAAETCNYLWPLPVIGDFRPIIHQEFEVNQMIVKRQKGSKRALEQVKQPIPAESSSAANDRNSCPIKDHEAKPFASST